MSFVPGMSVGGRSQLSPKPLESVVVTPFTAQNSGNIAWPEDRLPNDVFILFDTTMYLSSSAPGPFNPTPPTGFEQLCKNDDFYAIASGVVFIIHSQVSFRIIEGDEIGNIAGLSSGYNQKILYRIRGSNRMARRIFHNSWTTAWGSNPSAQVQNAPAVPLPCVVLGDVSGYEQNFSASPAFAVVNSMAEDLPGGSFANARHRVGRTIYAAGETPVQHSIDSTGRAVLNSGMFWFE